MGILGRLRETATPYMVALAASIGTLHAEEPKGIEHATRQELIMLLDGERFDQRNSAMLELIRRGRQSIATTRALPSWMEELTAEEDDSREVKERLKKVEHEMQLEQARLSWEGMTMPEMKGYTNGQEIGVRECISQLNRNYGGGIELPSLRDPFASTATLTVSETGIPFWEFVRRNSNESFGNNQGYIFVQNGKEKFMLDIRGALVGKLRIVEGIVYFDACSDPRISLMQTNLVSMTANTKRLSKKCTVPLQPTTHYQYEAGGAAFYMQLPSGYSMKNVESIDVAVAARGAPLEHAEQTNFSESTIHTFTDATVEVLKLIHDKEQQSHRVRITIRPKHDYHIAQSANNYFAFYKENGGVPQQLEFSHCCPRHTSENVHTYDFDFTEAPDRLLIRFPKLSCTNTKEEFFHFDL